MTGEELERKRARDRQRRANMTPEQRDRNNEQRRERYAQRRTPEGRERFAPWLTPEEWIALLEGEREQRREYQRRQNEQRRWRRWQRVNGAKWPTANAVLGGES